MQLCEQYRPRSWTEVVGQPKAVATIDRLRKRGLGGRAFWISGQSGTGKTTIARLIAAEVAEDWSTLEFIDPSKLDADTLDSIESKVKCTVFGKGFCFVVNEAHGLTTSQIRRLLGLTETIPTWITWIFTTTCDGEDVFADKADGPPLLSRCTRIELSRRNLCEIFAKKLQEVARKEGLDGKPLEAYVRVMKDCGNNLRAGYQHVESGAMLD